MGRTRTEGQPGLLAPDRRHFGAIGVIAPVGGQAARVGQLPGASEVGAFVLGGAQVVVDLHV